MCTVRDLLVMARHNLIPPQLAVINSKTGTPLRLILLYGTVCGAQAPCISLPSY